jgi:hypothetical protein
MVKHKRKEKGNHMSRAVTEGQARSLIGSFTLDTPWNEIQGNQQATQNFLELPASERGRRFAAFVANGCRLIIGEPKVIKLDFSKQFNPAEFIGGDWKIWRGPADGGGLKGNEDLDIRSLALAEVNLALAVLETCLKEGETSIGGEEKLNRLKTLEQKIRLGGNVFLALWQDWQANKENSCLEWLRKNREVISLDFFGLVLRDPHGSRYIPCLYWRDGQWCWNYRWLDSTWNSGHCSWSLASN